MQICETFFFFAQHVNQFCFSVHLAFLSFFCYKEGNGTSAAEEIEGLQNQSYGKADKLKTKYVPSCFASFEQNRHKKGDVAQRWRE